MTKLGDLIKAKRKAEGLSLRDFAERCDLSHSYIKNLEDNDPRSGKNVMPTIESLGKIAVAIGMPMDILLAEIGYLNQRSGKFVCSNLKLIRGDKSYEEIVGDINLKTGNRIEATVYKSIEEGSNENPSPIFVEILARYLGVDHAFFFYENTVESLGLARKYLPYRNPDSGKENILYLLEDDLKEFVKDPGSREYLKLAKELRDKKIKVQFIRDTLFDG